jgi:hypothetical protein
VDFFADVDFATKAGKYVMYVLAVAGGFLIGNLLTLFICRLLAKFAFKHKINHRLEQVARILGGIAVALLVAYLLFQFGPGWGLGGSGSGEGNDSGGQTPGSENLGKEKQPPGKSATSSETVSVTRLVVTIQPAMNYPKTFRFEGEPDGIDLDAATKKLDELKAAGGDKLQLLELRVFKNSSEVGTRDVSAFIEHANNIGIHTRVEKLDRRLE